MHDSCKQCLALADKAFCYFIRHSFTTAPTHSSFSGAPTTQPDTQQPPWLPPALIDSVAIYSLNQTLLFPHRRFPSQPEVFTLYCTKWGSRCVLQEVEVLTQTFFIKKFPIFFPSISTYASKPDLIATNEVFCYRRWHSFQSPWLPAYTTQQNHLMCFTELLSKQHD